MKRRNRRGFTLIEVIVAITIMGMILPLVGTALYQFIKVPPEETHELTAINDVSLALDWITDDASRASTFFPGSYPLPYAIFGWVDYTTPEELTHRVSYYWSEDGRLMRQEKIEGVVQTTHAVAHYIANHGDVNFDLVEGVVVMARVKSSVPHLGGYRTDEGTAYIARVGGSFSGGDFFGGRYAILAAGKTKSIEISGTKVTIKGDLFCNGDISVTGSDHSVNGQVFQIWDGVYKISPGSEEGWPEEPYRLNGMPEDWPPYTVDDFIEKYGNTTEFYDEDDGLYGNLVNLDDYVYVNAEGQAWLPEGIYYNEYEGGTIKLNTNDVYGEVTIISDYVDIQANCYLMAFVDEGVLLYGSAGEDPEIIPDGGTVLTDNAVKISTSSGGEWWGMLYAPFAEAELSGSTTLHGSAYTNVFHLSGSGELMVEW